MASIRQITVGMGFYHDKFKDDPDLGYGPWYEETLSSIQVTYGRFEAPAHGANADVDGKNYHAVSEDRLYLASNQWISKARCRVKMLQFVNTPGTYVPIIGRLDWTITTDGPPVTTCTQIQGVEKIFNVDIDIDLQSQEVEDKLLDMTPAGDNWELAYIEGRSGHLLDSLKLHWKPCSRVNQQQHGAGGGAGANSTAQFNQQQHGWQEEEADQVMTVDEPSEDSADERQSLLICSPTTLGGEDSSLHLREKEGGLIVQPRPPTRVAVALSTGSLGDGELRITEDEALNLALWRSANTFAPPYSRHDMMVCMQHRETSMSSNPSNLMDHPATLPKSRQQLTINDSQPVHC